MILELKKQLKIAAAGLCMTLLVTQSAFAEDLHIQSDNTWKTSKFEEPWWHSIDFDDSKWVFATSPSSGICDTNTVPQPNIAATMWAPTPMSGDTVYFRKKFTLDKKPDKAFLKTVFDDDGDIYINSHLVRRDRSGVVDQEPFTDDISNILQVGSNVIGLYVVDSHDGCQSAQARVDLELTFGEHRLNVPMFKQDDPQWENDTYAGGARDGMSCGETLGSCGCATTSTAMILRYLGATRSSSGQETSPKTLNEYFKRDSKCSTMGCISLGYAFGAVRWAAVNQYTAEASKKFGTQKVEWVDRTTPSTNDIQREIALDNPVALQVDSKKHWVVAKGTSKDGIIINDPFFNKELLSDTAYQNKASAMIRFKKTNSDFRIVQIVAAPGQNVFVTDPLGRGIGRIGSGELISEIPSATYHFEEVVGGTKDGTLENSEKEGVWIATIRQPEDGEYKVDIGTKINDEEYVIGVYGSNKEGESIHELVKGTSAIGDEHEVEFQYDSTASEPKQDMLIVQKKRTNKKITPYNVVHVKKTMTSSQKLKNTKSKCRLTKALLTKKEVARHVFKKISHHKKFGT